VHTSAVFRVGALGSACAIGASGVAGGGSRAIAPSDDRSRRPRSDETPLDGIVTIVHRAARRRSASLVAMDSTIDRTVLVDCACEELKGRRIRK
jgi:hypothetical protein